MFQKKIIAAALSLTAFAGAAPLATPAYAAPAESERSSLTISGGVAATAEYLGSDEVRARPVLAIDYQSANGFFASTARGLGYGTKLGGFTVSGALGYDAGRSDEKENLRSGSDYLRGMGEIKGSTVAYISIGYDLGPVHLKVSSAQALSNRERGNTYQFGASMPVMKTASDQVTVGLGAKFGDSKNTQTFYGVTAAQSNTSNFQQYHPESGLQNVNLGINWNHVLNKEWSVRTSAGVARLEGDAAKSPIVTRRTSPALLVAVNYKFF